MNGLEINTLIEFYYSNLSNNLGGWNNGGGAELPKSINVEVGINVEWRVEKI